MDTIRESVRQAVNAIYKSQGLVTPSALLAAAEPAESPIHKAFEWDDKKAGNEYRLIQARTWIRKVEVVVEERAERMVHVPVFTDDGGRGEGHYKPASVIVRSVDEYEAAMSAVKSRLGAAKASYDELKLAADTHRPKRVPNFKWADRGFEMVTKALNV